MSRLRSLSFLGLLLAAVAALGARPAVVVDQDPNVNFAAYRTFAFLDAAGGNAGEYSTLMTQHLMQATRMELERRGYVYDENAPQLMVHFLLNVQQRQELRSSPASAGFIGPRGYRIGGGYDLSTVTYKAGTLRIDLVDTQRNALVWQGVAEGTVAAKAQKNPAATIGRVVTQMFAGFPGSAAR